MIKDGKQELAATILQWAQARSPESSHLSGARRLAYLKLMEKYQEFNPFKLIVYGGQIDQPVAQMNKISLPQSPAEAR
jgi:hypothetical protein